MAAFLRSRAAAKFKLAAAAVIAAYIALVAIGSNWFVGLICYAFLLLSIMATIKDFSVAAIKHFAEGDCRWSCCMAQRWTERSAFFDTGRIRIFKNQVALHATKGLQ